MQNIKTMIVELMKVRQNINSDMIYNFNECYLESSSDYTRLLASIDGAIEYMKEAGEIMQEIETSQVFVEKASTEQYRLSKFKKKYHYDPSKKTITVDGEVYKVDLDHYKSGVMYCKNQMGATVATIRQTAADLQNDDPVIHFDRNFFKLKNPKRQDAILQHEIGHTKLHNTNLSNPHTDKSAVSGNAFNEMFKVAYKSAEEQVDILYKSLFGRSMTSSEKKELITTIKKTILPKKDEYMKLSTNQQKAKLRDDMIKIAKKYTKNSDSSHANPQEVEADRYSANRTSEKDIKRGVREAYKHAKKDEDIRKDIKALRKIQDPNNKANLGIDRETVAATKKNLNKEGQVDMERRSKALKDDELRNSKIYK